MSQCYLVVYVGYSSNEVLQQSDRIARLFLNFDAAFIQKVICDMEFFVNYNDEEKKYSIFCWFLVKFIVYTLWKFENDWKTNWKVFKLIIPSDIRKVEKRLILYKKMLTSLQP